ncbi:MAG: hypothetical protein HY286_07890 [Planctomycetes bacterium]|nr:hypothetical protein [Planctomycetota bacterium]
MVVLFCAAPAHAQFGSYDIHPRTYKSKNGRYELYINPTVRTGAGPADMRLSLDGKELWKKQLSYTLVNAAVCDNGTTIGYGYTKGTGWFINGEFIVTILGSAGDVRHEDRTPQTSTGTMHSAPTPAAKSIVLDEPNNRAVVVIYNDDFDYGVKSWWTYQLSTGVKNGTYERRALIKLDETLREDITIKPIAGSSLFLIQWFLYDSLFGSRKDRKVGALFTLVDSEFDLIWSLAWRDDYTVNTSDEAAEKLHSEIYANGAILECDNPGQFTIRQVKTSKAVTFEIRKSPKEPMGWSVQEIAREEYKSPKQPNSQLARPEDRAFAVRVLKHLGSIAIGGSDAASRPEPDEFLKFSRDDSGRFLLLMKDGLESFKISLVDGNFKILKAFHAPDIFNDTLPLSQIVPIARDLWLLAGSSVYGERPRGAAGIFNVSSGEFTPMPNMPAYGIAAVEPARGGGFVVLAKKHMMDSIVDEIYKTGKDGSIIWTIGRGAKNREGTLSSPEDIAVLENGDIAVVESEANDIKLFDQAGVYKCTIKLGEAGDHKIHYPSGISSDRAGGVIIYDSGSAKAFVHLDADWKVVAEFNPKFGDEQEVTFWGKIRTGSDHKFWIADGIVLYQIDGNGVVQTALGESPDSRPGRIGSMSLDRGDRIFAFDEWTGAVHVFDPAGLALRRCWPGRNDRDGTGARESIVASDSGDVFVQYSRNDLKQPFKFIQFDGTGKRVAEKTVSHDGESPLCIAVPRNGGFWALADRKVYLLNNKWEVALATERDSENDWLQEIECAQCAPDGTLAAFDGKMHIYDPAGRAVRSIDFPAFIHDIPFAFDGSRFVLVKVQGNQSTKPRVLACDAFGKCIFEFAPPEMKTIAGAWFVKNGKELLLFDGEFTLHRYEMPAPAAKVEKK